MERKRKKLVTRPKEISVDMFGDDRQTWKVYEWIRSGRLRGIRLGKRSLYVPTAEYERLKREMGIES